MRGQAHARSLAGRSPRESLAPQARGHLPGGGRGGRRARAADGPGAPVPRLCVIGSANLDYTVALPRLPRVGETVSSGTLLVNRGGKGANQAVAARRLGAEVRLIGCVGDDDSGGDIRRGLLEQGIGVDGLVTTPDAATGTALIFVDRAGYNQVGVAPGATHKLT